MINAQGVDGLRPLKDSTITYDVMGNPESYLGKTLSWEGKQLTSVTDGTHSYSYSYNEDGLRLRKVVDGTDTEYYYNGSVLMYMITGSGSTAIRQRFSYDAADNLVAVVYKVGSGTSYIYYYLRNAQGDIVKLIDSSGNTVVEYLYDSWGKLIATTGSLANTVGANQPFRYRGYVYDEETGFYYLQSRYYDPTTCRFISADVLLSTGQGVLGHNSFAYCGNNPVVRIDSNGKFWLTVIIVTAVVLTVGLTATGCSNLVPVYMDTAYPELLLGSKELNTDTADLSEYNCMGYAFGIESNCEPVGWFDGMSSDGLCDCLEATFGDGIRKLTSINDKLEPDEYMIAVNCSEIDFHFIRRNDNGDWYEKCGIKGPFQQVSKDFVSNSIWNSRKVGNKQTPKYYSGTRFLAVKKDWRKYLK